MYRDDDARLQYVMLALERLEHAADPPLQGRSQFWDAPWADWAPPWALAMLPVYKNVGSPP
jgi:hypothetical protein